MWYVLTFAGIVAMVACYRLKKTRMRDPKAMTGHICHLANDTAVIACGCLVLAAIFLLILCSSPSPAKYKATAVAAEAVYAQAMAEHLGRYLASKVGKSPSAIVIRPRSGGDRSAAYWDAAATGLQAGFGDGVQLIVKQVGPDLSKRDADTGEPELAATPGLTGEALDEYLREYADCRYLVSFVDLPEAYFKTNAAYKVRQEELAVGAVTRNVYLLGPTIAGHEVTACVVPRRQFEYHGNSPATTDNVEGAFNSRYHLVTPDNVLDFWKRNRRMMKVARIAD